MVGFIGDLLANSQGPPVGQAPATAGPPQPVPVNPGDAGPQQADPALEQNKGLWRGFFQKMQDPNFRSAVMQVGIGMMRSQQPGENAGDVVGQALGNGVATLDMLRQRDRAQGEAEAERTRKAGIEERETKVSERGATTSETLAGVAVGRAGVEAKDSTARWEQANNELQEAIRHNKATEVIDALRAKADNIRATAYGDFRKGKSSAEVTKMNALSQKYQAQGIDPVTADALAVEYLTETGKAKNPADRVRSLYEARVKAYGNSLEAFDKPLDAEMARKFLQESIDLDRSTEQVLNPVGTPAPSPGGAGNAAFAPPSTPLNRNPAAFAALPVEPLAAGPAAGPPQAAGPATRSGIDPVLAKQVQDALKRGVDVGQIRLRIQQQGKNPDDYL